MFINWLAQHPNHEVDSAHEMWSQRRRGDYGSKCSHSIWILSCEQLLVSLIPVMLKREVIKPHVPLRIVLSLNTWCRFVRKEAAQGGAHRHRDVVAAYTASAPLSQFISSSSLMSHTSPEQNFNNCCKFVRKAATQDGAHRHRRSGKPPRRSMQISRTKAMIVDKSWVGTPYPEEWHALIIFNLYVFNLPNKYLSVWIQTALGTQ
jgi:hypothetical protein